jgi:hypothetical protein
VLCHFPVTAHLQDQLPVHYRIMTRSPGPDPRQVPRWYRHPEGLLAAPERIQAVTSAELADLCLATWQLQHIASRAESAIWNISWVARQASRSHLDGIA